MKERPILFADAMVRAILDGRKTQTRRLATRRHFSEELHARALAVGVEAALLEMPDPPHVRSPFGAPGDLLWVRECWATEDPGKPWQHVAYRADGVFGAHGCDGDGGRLFVRHGWLADQMPADATGECRSLRVFGDRWRPSIHMPRWASRLSLRVTSVRVERLRAITEEDAIAEGIVWADGAWRVDGIMASTAIGAFSMLWDRLAQPGSTWAGNPWVWVVGFERVEVLP